MPPMGAQTVGTVLDAVFGVGKIPTAAVTQGIQRTIAEKTAEVVRAFAFVAGEIFAFCILKKIVICHSISFFVVLKWVS